MAENFKKYTGGPTPVLPKGSQHFGGKTTTTKPTHQAQPGHPHLQQKAGGKGDSNAKHPHSPPVTPHATSSSAGLMSPVSRYGQVRMHSPPSRILKHRTMHPEPVLPKGSQEWSGKVGSSGSPQQHATVQGGRHGASGGASMRPNITSSKAGTPNQHSVRMQAGAIAPKIGLKMTKSIRGLIGKHSNKHRSPY